MKGHRLIIGMTTGVCSYVQKHVIDALEGFSQFLANEVSKVRNIVFVIVFIFGFINCNVVLLLVFLPSINGKSSNNYPIIPA